MKRHIPLLVFVISAAIGLSLTYVILDRERAVERREFEILAEEAVDRIRGRTEQNFSLIAATHSFSKRMAEPCRGPNSRALPLACS